MERIVLFVFERILFGAIVWFRCLILWLLFAVPGFMKPTKLMIKDSKGNQVPFEVDGVEWIDGSVQAE